jgi:hypothetical protein
MLQILNSKHSSRKIDGLRASSPQYAKPRLALRLFWELASNMSLAQQLSCYASLEAQWLLLA